MISESLSNELNVQWMVALYLLGTRAPIYLLTYLLTYLITYLLTYLLTQLLGV